MTVPTETTLDLYARLLEQLGEVDRTISKLATAVYSEAYEDADESARITGWSARIDDLACKVNRSELRVRHRLGERDALAQLKKVLAGGSDVELGNIKPQGTPEQPQPRPGWVWEDHSFSSAYRTFILRQNGVQRARVWGADGAVSWFVYHNDYSCAGSRYGGESDHRMAAIMASRRAIEVHGGPDDVVDMELFKVDVPVAKAAETSKLVEQEKPTEVAKRVLTWTEHVTPAGVRSLVISGESGEIGCVHQEHKGWSTYHGRTFLFTYKSVAEALLSVEEWITGETGSATFDRSAIAHLLAPNETP